MVYLLPYTLLFNYSVNALLIICQLSGISFSFDFSKFLKILYGQDTPLPLHSQGLSAVRSFVHERFCTI